MSKLKFIKSNIFGSTIYQDTTGKFELFKHRITASSKEKWYIRCENAVPEWQGRGYDTVEEAEEALNKHVWNEDMQFLASMYGFVKSSEDNTYFHESPAGCVHITDWNADPSIEISTDDSSESFDNIEDALKYLDQLYESFQIDIFSCATLSNKSNTKTIVNAAISTRDLSKNLVRVKSSNMWAYTINIKDSKSKTGDVLVQFKGPKGGPGDIYLYYDVPVVVWRKWLSATSKGHYFWVNIRNNYMYRKLTGDKRGKLKNAVN